MGAKHLLLAAFLINTLVGSMCVANSAQAQDDEPSTSVHMSVFDGTKCPWIVMSTGPIDETPEEKSPCATGHCFTMPAPDDTLPEALTLELNGTIIVQNAPLEEVSPSPADPLVIEIPRSPPWLDDLQTVVLRQ